MSPRPYRLGQRETASQQTRARIVAAAIEVLREGDRLIEFSIDAVARRADVVRMTVYYQFGARRGLLEALFDELARRGLVDRLRVAYRRADPLDRLDGLVAAFGSFWASDRVVIRRLRSLAVHDPELDQALRSRDERRRGHMRNVAESLVDQRPGRSRPSLDEVVSVLYTLTSFETFDTLAGPERRPDEVTTLVQRLARAALALSRNSRRSRRHAR
jgi:AcrR family transcriptional regulator